MADAKQPQMIEKKVPSALPFWLVGVFWILYAGILPLYRLPHFLIAAALSVGVFFLSRRLLPERTVLVEAPPAPAYSGAYDIGAAERQFLERLKAADEAIENEEVSAGVRRISQLSASIFEYLSAHPEKKTDLRRFTSYYLPTVLKILDAYDRMEEQAVKGSSITSAMSGIERTLGTVAEAFEHQLDALYSADTLDVETDIAVLESLLRQEGLAGDSPDAARLKL